MGDFAYFMIRVRRHAEEGLADTISGMLEHLGTGEKQSFASADELLWLVSGRPAPEAIAKMQGAEENRNAANSL